MKHIVCFSKGVSSALVAVSVVQRYGSDNVVLLNHDLNPRYEHPDIKRFAFEISNFLNIPITYANFQDVSSPDEIPSQFQVSMAAKAFKIGRYAVCTNHLKTLNFQNWMRKNSPPSFNTFVYYGFAKNELERATRRTKIIHAMGYTAVYPLIDWITTLTLQNIGISPPKFIINLNTLIVLVVLRLGSSIGMLFTVLVLIFGLKLKLLKVILVILFILVRV